MKIAIVCRMPQKGYSGGRFHAWILAECLAYAGNDICFLTNNKPPFYDDFIECPTHSNINVMLDSFINFEKHKLSMPKELDFVIVVESRSKDRSLIEDTDKFIHDMNAKMILLSFETANWFNELSPGYKDEAAWDNNKWICSKNEGFVLSTMKEGMKFAKEFYGDNGITHIQWNPPVNTWIANKVTIKKDKKRILYFARIGDKHKGGDDFLEFLGEELRGYTIVIVVGVYKEPEIYESYMADVKAKSELFGIKIEFKTELTELEKYEEYAKANYLIYPSYFEGFGLPPVEALYMNTVPIVYDLPVIHESCGDMAIFCERGNPYDMRKKLIEFDKNENAFINYRNAIANIVDFKKQSFVIDELLKYL